MKTLYRFDDDRYPTGATKEVGERDPIPSGWTDQEPPSWDEVRFFGSIAGWRPAPTQAVWEASARQIERRKQELLTEVDRERTSRTRFYYDFGAIEAEEEAGSVIEAGVRSLQVRDAQDQANWLDLLQIVKEEIERGNGDRPVITSIRTADNALIHATNEETNTVLRALIEWRVAVKAHAWALKRQIAQAPSLVDLKGIEVRLNWPNDELSHH